MKTLVLVLLLSAPALLAQDNFSVIYETPRIAEKKALFQALSKDEQIEVRRENFAWGTQYLELSKDQAEYLDRFSAALPTITKDEADKFESEALELFTYEEGSLLFGSIGPFKSCRKEIVFIPNLQTSCPCSVGSSFNMSCSGDCVAAGNRCIVQGDGCGFAWLYSCNGLCQVAYNEQGEHYELSRLRNRTHHHRNHLVSRREISTLARHHPDRTPHRRSARRDLYAASALRSHGSPIQS